jgi:hypothetical protein
MAVGWLKERKDRIYHPRIPHLSFFISRATYFFIDLQEMPAIKMKKEESWMMEEMSNRQATLKRLLAWRDISSLDDGFLLAAKNASISVFAAKPSSSPRSLPSAKNTKTHPAFFLAEGII